MNLNALHLRSPITKIALAVASISLSTVALAADNLQKMSVSQPNANTTELNLEFGQTPVMPIAYQMENPSRLVLDFNNVNNQLLRLTPINQGNIKDVTAIADNTTTRLIITLKQPGQYTTRVQNNRLIIAVQNPIAVVAPLPIAPVIPNTPVVVAPVMTQTPVAIVQEPVVVAPMMTQTPVAIVQEPVVVAPIAPSRDIRLAPKQNNTMVVKVNPLLNPASSRITQYNYDGLNSLNYSASGNGGGIVSIGLNNENIPLDVQRAGDELVIRLTGATIPSRLVRQTAGSGLIKDISTTNQGKNGVIRIAMNSDYEYKAFQAGNSLNITIAPPKKLTEATLEEKVYTGAPISMEFQDMAVRNILQLLGQQTDTNIIASDSVSGNITLRLINVPWDQALDIILKSKNLDKRVNGNVMWVAPAGELQDSEIKDRENAEKKKSLDPLRTEYIRLNYATAGDIKGLVEAAGRGSSSQSDGRSSLLSSRGTLTADTRTNTIIIQDTSASISNIRDLLSKLDIPVKQVMIEARIVNASDTFSKNLGVKWGVKDTSGTSSNVLKSLDNLSVDLGVAATTSVSFGLLSLSDKLLDLQLSAMQADGTGEIISSPKILTADKQTAKVLSGTQIPYEISTPSGATSITLVDAALSLEVTPNITPEGRIAMKLNIENGTPGQVYASGVAINKDSISTNVIVDDGQTVVLGGVFKNTVTNASGKVPFIGDIPYVGKLFRNSQKVNNKSEVLIFVTPKVVNDAVNRIN